MGVTSTHILAGVLLCLIPFQLPLFIHRVASLKGDDSDAERAKERITRHPYIAIIRNFGRYDCTGVLIGEKAVMTAAQCVDPRYDRSPLPEIWLNSSTSFKPSEGAFIRQAVDVAMHPNYTGDGYDGYDIAVLLLNESIPPKHIRTYDSWEFNGERLSILGYGRSSSTGSISPVLLIGEVTMVESERCVNNKDVFFLKDRMICVEGSIPCDGDQGGPVIVNNDDPKTDALVGIISATSCADNQRMAAIQNITHISSAGWARHQVKEWNAFGDSGCSSEEYKKFGESLDGLPPEETGKRWEEFFKRCP